MSLLVRGGVLQPAFKQEDCLYSGNFCLTQIGPYVHET